MGGVVHCNPPGNKLGRFLIPPGVSYARLLGLKEHWARSCIYGIVHDESSIIYVGSASNLQKRINHHRCTLRSGKHDNGYLHNSWVKYGEPSFSFIILEECAISLLAEREAFWMKLVGAGDKSLSFNLDILTPRKMHSEETKRKIGDAHRGRTHTPEMCAKMSAVRKGVKRGPLNETPERQAARKERGRIAWLRPELRKMMSEMKTGRKLSAETKAKISRTRLIKYGRLCGNHEQRCLEL